MDCVFPTNHPLSPAAITSFSPEYPFKLWKKKKTVSPELSKKFPVHFPLSSPLRFRISARFRRPPNRQNYLRKKLTQHTQQVSLDSNFQNPVRKFVDNDGSVSNLDSFSEKRRILDANDVAGSSGVKETELESKSKLLGGTVLFDKLENWVEQYKKDVEFWGIGTGAVFTVFHDSEGKVERVVVNEDEILRRSGVEPLLYNDDNVADLPEVSERISYAKSLATEMEENGNDLIPRNSSVVKFVTSEGKSGLVNMIQGVNLKPVLDSKLSSFGVVLACGVFVVLAFKQLFTAGESKQEYTRYEKEMMARKLKAKMEKERKTRGVVEVIQDSIPASVSVRRPQLDKQELTNSIVKAGESSSTIVSTECQINRVGIPVDHQKIQEIKVMARQARELEKVDSLTDAVDEEALQTLSGFSISEERTQKHGFVGEEPQMDLPVGYEGQTRNCGQTPEHTSTDDSKIKDGFVADEALTENGWTQTSKLIEMKFPDESEGPKMDVEDIKLDMHSVDAVQFSEQYEAFIEESRSAMPDESSVKKKFKVIGSVKEAREYLSKKRDNIKSTVQNAARSSERVHRNLTMLDKKSTDVVISWGLNASEKASDPDLILASDNSTLQRAEYFSNISRKTDAVEGEKDDLGNFRLLDTESAFTKLTQKKETDISMSQEQRISEDVTEGKGAVNLQLPGNFLGQKSRTDLASTVNRENWIVQNFHELEPIVKKIGAGFRDNYMVAKEKTNQDMNLQTDLSQLMPDKDDSELEWMKDERLREIVFNVRDNEMAGRDPFHQMDEQDKLAFFSGLEKKVEQENTKLANLHEWVHSNIENLDYGADGISLYDPPEKVIPRWKGPPVEKIPEFLKSSTSPQKGFVGQHVAKLDLMKLNGEDPLQLSKESPSSDGLLKDSALSNQSKGFQEKSSKAPRIALEGSDGSVRAGKRSGKEYWQHTKKWSQGFIESYNAETDPEIKAVMKDMGKDLDRWITEKEIKEAADLMDKLPERAQELIKEKLNKVKREMELFGPQAVASKYREYADEKEEDSLWWLDLPYVLCIELYTEEQGEQRVGFYSLEMAADLELDPKPYHVIAFEDAGDCKNMCYIIQAHLEMLGKGNAFVVARPPKDAFREAKANGFSVTVIRRGEMKLNVDQTLEEVEEVIDEIGSKIYHDTITRERSVDISAVMKGVFGLKKPIRRRRSKRKVKNPANS